MFTNFNIFLQQVLFSRLHNPVSAADKCTMFSDRNLINRRSVKKDVDSAVNANRRFFTLEVQSRVVAAGMIEIGMESLEEEPDTLNNVETWNNKDKKEYLTKLSTSIVDKYILDEVKHRKIVKAVKQLEEGESFGIQRIEHLMVGTSVVFQVARKLSNLMESGDKVTNSLIVHLSVYKSNLFSLKSTMMSFKMTCITTRKLFSTMVWSS